MTSQRIGLMCPVTSRGCSTKSNEQPITKAFLPTLAQTVSWHEVISYVGYDDTDPLWSDEGWRRETLSGYPQLAIRPIRLVGLARKITSIWNAISSAAVAEGCQYLVPANDDLKFLNSWAEPSIKVIDSMQGLGMAVWNDTSYPGFPTFHMVGKPHYDLFKCYYPLPWEGAHQDPWIYDVYNEYGRAKWVDVKVANHVGTGVRYDYGGCRGYRAAVDSGRARLAAALGVPATSRVPKIKIEE